jgi:hypothetical protein
MGDGVGFRVQTIYQAEKGISCIDTGGQRGRNLLRRDLGPPHRTWGGSCFGLGRGGQLYWAGSIFGGAKGAGAGAVLESSCPSRSAGGS